MELWIRSQSKHKLVKVNELNILGFADFVVIRGCNNQGTSFWLGNYKTKERALEVLDEIQKILKPQLIIKDSGKIVGSFEDAIIREGATYELKELTTYVYGMPEE